MPRHDCGDSVSAAAGKQAVTVEGRPVTLSNLDKVLYPSGFTKGQVIDYYTRAAATLLPHIRKRPITLKRYPNGVRGKYFYEKNAPSFTPQWVRTFPVPRRAGGDAIRYVLLGDLPSLVWAANAASLEVHPFLYRVPNLNRPDFVVFDLDPGTGAGILDCASVALLLQKELAAKGLECFPKVSGSKGMQIYAPLNTPASFAETRPFAQALARSLEREHPDRVLSKMTKEERNGKVFIDWSQNSDFKTTVAAYSLRARGESPLVSLPVRWEELRAAVEQRDVARLEFSPEAALARIAQRGDLFAPVLELKQKLPRK